MNRADMWVWAALIFIVIASCNAEPHPKMVASLPRADSRILGETNTINTIEKYPFAVQVFSKSPISWLPCGGSLVSTRHVLTAAHCFLDGNGQQGDPTDYVIRASTTIFNSSGSLHSITAIKIHELFKIRSRDNDVAVALMASPVDLITSVARPVFLAYQDAVVPENSSITVVGWGWRTPDVAPHEKTFLKESMVQIINLNTCRARLMNRTRIAVTSNMICAGILDLKGRIETCRGDMGGALLYQGRVVGIASTSAVTFCGNPNYPAVYTRVSRYTNWINNKIIETSNAVSTNPGNIFTKPGSVSTNPGSTGTPSSKVGAITLLTPILYLILSV